MEEMAVVRLAPGYPDLLLTLKERQLVSPPRMSQGHLSELHRTRTESRARCKGQHTDKNNDAYDNFFLFHRSALLWFDKICSIMLIAHPPFLNIILINSPY